LLLVTFSLLGAEAVLNWWIDPFGTFWKAGALTAAERGGCLVSQEMVGNAYPQFKLDVFRHRPTHAFVIGSSRTVKIAAHPQERTFSNLGIPNLTPAVLLHVLRAIPAGAPRQTVYIGVEGFWFNHSFSGAPAAGWYPEAKYLLSGNTFLESVRFVRRAPWELRHRWRRVVVGGRCVIGRTDPGLTWRLDGSRLYGYELQPGLYKPAVVPFTTDVANLDFGYYDGWTGLDAARLRTFDQALTVAQRRGWRVVGFVPPNPSRVARYLRTSGATGPAWKQFEGLMPAVFRRHGFRFVDLTDVRAVPCGQGDFADGTFHPDASCSQRIRDRLDRAAR
jgi:hypothetical protein